MLNQQSYILLVDDEPNNLLLLESLLGLQEYQTQSAHSGKEALNLAQSSKPDLILLDVMMPGMNGFEVCHSLRQQEDLKTVPIVFLTALDDDESRIQGIEMMADDYITKPFDTKLLLAKVKNILHLNQIRSQSHQSQLETERSSEKLDSFVPTQFLKRIAPDDIASITLGETVEAEVSILYCDIRQFTAIAESQASSQTFEWLNYFLSQMSSCINYYHGFIDKYLGDAILAIFDRKSMHSLDAVHSAIAMQASINQMNKKTESMNLPMIKMGIGIDTGVATIGVLGTAKRMETTVIGDVVNTASRLEELTKIYNCDIIASESTVSRLSQVNPTEPQQLTFYPGLIDRVIPRNKQKAINIYKIVSCEADTVEK